MTDSSGFNGAQRQSDGIGEWGSLAFMMKRLLRRVSTATLVKVQAVTNEGEVSPVGFVDILPLVNLTDGAGVAVPHQTIHRCPYMRVQGGANAIILDPQVGDIGIALFADRDISSVTANKGQANPGSRRRFDMADGLYIGGCLNGTPEQWVRFSAEGIEIVSPTKVKLSAPDIEIDCATLEVNATTSVTVTTPTFTVNGDMHTTGDSLLDGGATVVGATVLKSTLAVTGAAGFASELVDGRTGKDIGGTHEHDHGTIAGSGHTGIVI